MGKPYAPFDEAGAGNELTVGLVRHSPRKQGDTDRTGLRSVAPALDPTDGDLRLVLAAYHMGPTRVSKILRDHPGLESEELIERHANRTTRRYVRKVLANPDWP